MRGGGLRLTVTRREYGLFQDGARPFAVWTLERSEASGDYQLVIGIRNSHDKSFWAGARDRQPMFVCDNLAFSGEITIARKHTRFIHQDLDRLVAEAVGWVGEARRFQDQRIAAYKGKRLSDTRVHDLLVRSVDAGVMAKSYIPKVLGEYREPRHEAFLPRSAWRLFNAYTEVFKGTNPLDLSARTTHLHGLLELATGVVAEPSLN